MIASTSSTESDEGFGATPGFLDELLRVDDGSAISTRHAISKECSVLQAQNQSPACLDSRAQFTQRFNAFPTLINRQGS